LHKVFFYALGIIGGRFDIGDVFALFYVVGIRNDDGNVIPMFRDFCNAFLWFQFLLSNLLRRFRLFLCQSGDEWRYLSIGHLTLSV
tara:strand:+ start:2283 stop:2540 length:258 start_codon:yes stop_codon:yes gene_type:complete